MKKANRDNSIPPRIHKAQDEDNDQNYAILVVGKMGVGKSSFCRMMAAGDQKQRIMVGGSMQSCTSQCDIYRSQLFRDIFKKDIYVVDTPGLDCKQLFLIIEKVDEAVSKYNLAIIGIAYVINLSSTREKPQEGMSIVQNFLLSLKMRYVDKINLSFCILTNYDLIFEREDTLKEKIDSYGRIFHEIHFGLMWQKRIFWINQPKKDIKVFHKHIQGECKQAFENQSKKLKQYLKFNAKKRIKPQNYKKCIQNFEENFLKDLQSRYHQQQYSNENTEVQFTLQFAKKSIWQTASDFNFGVDRMGGFGIGTILLGLATKSFMIPLALGCTAIIGLHHLKQPVIKCFQSKKEDKENIEIMLERRIKSALTLIVKKLIKIQSTTVTLSKKRYINSVKCVNIDEDGEQVEQYVKDNHHSNCYCAKLKAGKFRFVVECKSISNESYKKYLLEQAKKYFSKK